MRVVFDDEAPDHARVTVDRGDGNGPVACGCYTIMIEPTGLAGDPLAQIHVRRWGSNAMRRRIHKAIGAAFLREGQRDGKEL